jgi:hypothetical protein
MWNRASTARGAGGRPLPDPPPRWRAGEGAPARLQSTGQSSQENLSSSDRGSVFQAAR